MPNSYSNGVFSTSDTALAAYLYSIGRELLQVKKEETATVFLFSFSEVSPISPQVFAFETGTATGNINAFYKTYKKLLFKVKNG